jgi:hypothetical protein|nr:MAG TPA: hypothetical protein [Caudoviricetes sp.]
MTNPSLLRGSGGRMIAKGILCQLYCRQTKTIDISVTNLDGLKVWLMDIPFADFCIGIQNLKANTECSINTVMCKFVAEWSVTDCGLVLAYKGGEISLSSGRAGALALVEYAEDFIREVKEQLHEEA